MARADRQERPAARAFCRWFAVSLLILGGSFGSRTALADEPAGRSDDAAARLSSAKELFRQGVVLLDAGDLDGALRFFLRSRDVLPSSKNTTNAAICLDRLGRYDEALEMYEELLAKFSAELDAEDRANIGPALAGLRLKVASVTISANVQGLVVIDGRERGKLPLDGPLKVLGGHHVLRILKDGYGTFEKSLDVVAGTLTPVDARLDPLAGVALVRIEDPGHAGSELFIDRVRLGVTPWEGTLVPGRHVIWTRLGEDGSAPTVIDLLGGRSSTVEVKTGPLGPAIHVSVEPEQAQIGIDGVLFDTREWIGRLPVGSHRIAGSEDGYRTASELVEVEKGSSPITVTLRLAVDPNHPRWPKARIGRLFAGISAGYALGGALHGGAEEACPSGCANGPVVGGPEVLVRGGFRFENGLGVELSLGYAAYGMRVSRGLQSSYAHDGGRFPVAYVFDDDVQMTGPLVGIGASLRTRLFGQLFLQSRATLGLMFAHTVDDIGARARTTGPWVDAVVPDAGQSVSSLPWFFVPELALEREWAGLDFELGLGLAFFPTEGPTFDHREVGVAPECPAGAASGSVGCVPNSSILANERAYGPFSLFVPRLGVGYTF
jgi:PEGA domain